MRVPVVHHEPRDTMGQMRVGVQILVVCAWLAAQAVVASAQDVVAVSGRVLSKVGGIGVPGALVTAGASSVTTDADGAFSLALLPGPFHLVIKADHFIDQPLDLTVRPGMPAVVVELARAPVHEDVTVSGEAGTAGSTPTAMAVAPSAVLRVAGAGDNIFKALQTLPGINATDDFGSRLAVRGGGPDQNLTVMDGVEIHNPYRLFGFTSAFNPETVDRFELTAGGFGAEYGDRLSSLLLVENRSGTSIQAFTGSAALSLTDANVVVEGKLPHQKGSWLVTGRRTYYDLVADRITDTDLPSFEDVQAKGAWDLKPGHALTFFVLRSREKTDATFTDSGDVIAVGDLSRNDVASLSYRGVMSPRLTARSIVAWYDYKDDLGVDGSVKDTARRSNAPTDELQQRSSIVFTRALGVRDVSLRQQVDLQAGPHHLLGAGFDAHVLRTTWGWTIDGDRNSAVANGSSVAGGTGLPSLLASQRDTTRASAWLTDRLTLGRRLQMTPGVRLDRSGLNRELVVSPRMSLAIDLTPRTRVKGSAGLFTQSPGYEKLLQSDYFVDLTSDSARDLSSERSTHVIGALEREISASATARIEGYFKDFDRLIVGRLETPQEAAARVATYNFPAALANDIPAAPQITSIASNGASGQAYGFDIYVEKRQRAATDRVSGWLSYTWGKATVEAYGVRRPFDYDRRHSVSLVSTLGLSRRIDLSSTLRLASGFPTTVPIGVRLAADPAADGSGRLVPAVDAQGRPVWTVNFGDVTNLGRGRLPLFARLDIRMTFKSRNPNGRWQFYLDVLNALNRKNVSTLQPELQFDASSDRPKIGYSADSGLPRLPSFGLRFRF
jgi:TonB-dependent Receptor Plug Domain